MRHKDSPRSFFSEIKCFKGKKDPSAAGNTIFDHFFFFFIVSQLRSHFLGAGRGTSSQVAFVAVIISADVPPPTVVGA